MPKPATLELAAKETGFSAEALRQKAIRGEIPYYLPFGGGKIVVDIDEIQKLMLKNRVPTSEERSEQADAMLREMAKKRAGK